MAAFVALTSATVAAAAAPEPDGGWVRDDIEAMFLESLSSPYELDLAEPAFLRITDVFAPGDRFDVFDFDTLILTTDSFIGTGFGDNADADTGWTNSAFDGGEILLDAGLHSITVQRVGVASFVSTFFTRLDVAAEGCLAVIKECSAPGQTPGPTCQIPSVGAGGGAVQYRYEVTNVGSAETVALLAVEDDVLGPIGAGTLGSLAPGETLELGANDALGQTTTNTAVVLGESESGLLCEATDSATASLMDEQPPQKGKAKKGKGKKAKKEKKEKKGKKGKGKKKGRR